MLGIYYKAGDSRSETCLNELISLLTESGFDYQILNGNIDKTLLCKVGLAIVLGGDGSVLRAAKIVPFSVPIVAVNTGNVGFLTSYEPKYLRNLLEDIKNNNITFTKRKLMRVVYGENEYFAINDAVITKNHTIDSVSECIKLSLKIDGQFVDGYVGDGLILSTPTGSTAYAISAGGPIMVPNVDAYIAAPICAHSLHSRPIVFSQKSIAEIGVLSNTKECALFIDGEMTTALKPGSTIKILTSEKFVTICDESERFFSRLSEKLNQWSNNDLLEVDHG